MAKEQEHKGATEEEVWRKTTLSCLCMISLVKGADMQLFPSSFRAMEVDLSVHPFEMALLALCQGVSAAAFGPFWGNLVDSGWPRRQLLTLGCASWGFCTMALGCVSGLRAMAVLRVLNGAALAMLLPVVQSFVIDLAKSKDRGCCFGILYFSTNLGQVLACLLVTPLSNAKVWGYDGWRVALGVVGAISFLITLCVPLLVVETPHPWRPHRLGLRREVRKLACFFQIPTFCVIILQGVFGTIPGAAFSFVTMYFQYLGISDFTTALVISLHVIGDACGGLLGGIIGDALAHWSPRYGRALTAQISVIASIPAVAATFLLVPREPSSVGVIAGILFLLGLVGSWVAPGCICPIMCEIVPRSRLGSAYAWELAIVFCSGNLLGPTLVSGLSSRLFGYEMSTEQVRHMEPEVRATNARALGKALFFTTAVPYVLCAVLFSLLYFTHQKDSRSASLISDNEGDDSEDLTRSPSNERTRLTSRLPPTTFSAC